MVDGEWTGTWGSDGDLNWLDLQDRSVDGQLGDGNSRLDSWTTGPGVEGSWKNGKVGNWTLELGSLRSGEPGGTLVGLWTDMNDRHSYV